MAATRNFDEYLTSLSRLSDHVDPTIPTEASEDIRDAAAHFAAIAPVDRTTLMSVIQASPAWVEVLGLVVGLGRERLKGALRETLGTTGWIKLALDSPGDVIDMLDDNYDLIRLLNEQAARTYTLGDVLVARAGTRVTAAGAAKAGRGVEDAIEGVAAKLGLQYEARTRFVGARGEDAPCDLAIPDRKNAMIVIAAKGFDSTGSKLTDAVREIVEMSHVRLPRQYTMAVVDGIGWLSRQADLRRIHALWDSNAIDGLYTLADFDEFERDLKAAAVRLGLLAP